MGAATTSVKQSRTSATVVFLVETVELVARVPMASALVAPRRSAERGGVDGVRRARFTAPASSRRVQRPRRVRRPLGERLRAAGAARADRGRRGRRSGHVPAQGRARTPSAVDTLDAAPNVGAGGAGAPGDGVAGAREGQGPRPATCARSASTASASRFKSADQKPPHKKVGGKTFLVGGKCVTSKVVARNDGIEKKSYRLRPAARPLRPRRRHGRVARPRREPRGRGKHLTFASRLRRALPTSRGSSRGRREARRRCETGHLCRSL